MNARLPHTAHRRRSQLPSRALFELLRPDPEQSENRLHRTERQRTQREGEETTERRAQDRPPGEAIGPCRLDFPESGQVVRCHLTQILDRGVEGLEAVDRLFGA